MKKTVSILLSFFVAVHASAQGCSDAGFCSLGVLKNQQDSASNRKSLAIGLGYGNGELNTSTINPYLEYHQPLGKQTSLQVKLTAVYASGFLGSNFNVGDAFISFARASKRNRKHIGITWLAAVKVPFTRANDKNSKGLPLPLDYQSSLGTVDVVAGINMVANGKWEANAAFQAPLINRNRNSFLPDEHGDASVQQFQATNFFQRKADLLLRLGRYVQLSRSWTVKPNFLGIYHLGNDTYVDRFNARQPIDGSRGLTVNAGIAATKVLRNGTLEFVMATPVVYRQSRPDGLTRHAVINLQYKLNF